MKGRTEELQNLKDVEEKLSCVNTTTVFRLKIREYKSSASVLSIPLVSSIYAFKIHNGAVHAYPFADWEDGAPLSMKKTRVAIDFSPKISSKLPRCGDDSDYEGEDSGSDDACETTVGGALRKKRERRVRVFQELRQKAEKQTKKHATEQEAEAKREHRARHKLERDEATTRQALVREQTRDMKKVK
eukprot:TRINITY_DN9718_c0_g1_i2.p1 TRINITY_DN9718_c0_g1~~TRINITY_DN9718_c0_g1_i2.p1  ORF type:complete len:187 (-),score=9.57 TRINITY_DN9718_c0_g1_i2:956-1516(-)